MRSTLKEKAYVKQSSQRTFTNGNYYYLPRLMWSAQKCEARLLAGERQQRAGNRIRVARP